MKKNKIKNKKSKEEVLLIFLWVCFIITLILDITLFIIGIKNLLPVILIFVLSFIIGLFIVLLSKEVYKMKKMRESNIKYNA